MSAEGTGTNLQALATLLESKGWKCALDPHAIVVSLPLPNPPTRLLSALDWSTVKAQLSAKRTEMRQLVAELSPPGIVSHRCGSLFFRLATCVRCRRSLDVNPRSQYLPYPLECFCSCSCCQMGEDDSCSHKCVGVCRASSDKKPCKPIYVKADNQVRLCRLLDLPKPSRALRQMNRVALLIMMEAKRKGSIGSFSRLPLDVVRVILNLAFSPRLHVSRKTNPEVS